MPISICIAAPDGANSPSSAHRDCRSSFAVLMVGQPIGFLMLGAERQGLAVSESTLILDNLLAFACARVRFRRARRITALFWFLFRAVLVVLLIPTAIHLHDRLFDPRIALGGSAAPLPS